jgi:hypothetical protein
LDVVKVASHCVQLNVFSLSMVGAFPSLLPVPLSEVSTSSTSSSTEDAIDMTTSKWFCQSLIWKKWQWLLNELEHCVDRWERMVIVTNMGDLPELCWRLLACRI